jgi:hypothetical protein
MIQGGSGSYGASDYYAQPASFQNNGYSQGVTPTMGDNYGSQGGDVSAPWNQPGTGSRNNRGSADAQYGNGYGQTGGRFAPGRQQGSQPSNFGAPPMYYGR